MLGGSFNPAHEGHRFISLTALAGLGLDCVWWLVSPQNPLKPTEGMAPMAQRLEQAKKRAKDCRIFASAIENELGVRYTADTIRRLKRLYPKTQFVWLMGADNLRQISRWARWRDIFNGVPVAVLDRSPYSYKALCGPAAHSFRKRLRSDRQVLTLALETPPVWTYMRQRRHPATATDIRRGQSVVLPPKSGAT